jgi:GrpB-like predicted nucleotidyltransferase (UPF0157 family)
MQKKIEVIDHDPTWLHKYETERDLLCQIMGDAVVAIHHIGSTSVPGLAAKPVIDILIEATSLTAIDQLNSQMIAFGYEPRGGYGIPGRRFFVKGGLIRTHNVHVFQKGDDFNLSRHLVFRDYLRNHPQVAQEYGELKKKNAMICENDMERYCDGKDAFVKHTQSIALEDLESQKKPVNDEKN